MARKEPPERRTEREREALMKVEEEANEPTGPPRLETSAPRRPGKDLERTFRGTR
jgi:hypothetical protein